VIGRRYLVGEEDNGDGLSVGKHDLGVNVVLPLGHGLKGGYSGDVEHDEGTDGLLVVHLFVAPPPG